MIRAGVRPHNRNDSWGGSEVWSLYRNFRRRNSEVCYIWLQKEEPKIVSRFLESMSRGR